MAQKSYPSRGHGVGAHSRLDTLRKTLTGSHLQTENIFNLHQKLDAAPADLPQGSQFGCFSELGSGDNALDKEEHAGEDDSGWEINGMVDGSQTEAPEKCHQGSSLKEAVHELSERIEALETSMARQKKWNVDMEMAASRMRSAVNGNSETKKTNAKR
ncbi:uncharacterized protein ATNIH1004_009742 [Aspergillus tanneri]|uniref:Uncharacterized protein n=1 Tax=Aspergillus tanneri TaxID=1220188 RepID=A0A5M9MC17_9EURO|nr:uncharacterized protein ATNIH1004_009742 [Aspergillus tanneri]KAA8642980.1 hypothetical protein ATNIH1004_009742 [Aspergillus tanneri]